jgi:hypothetical protein
MEGICVYDKESAQIEIDIWAGNPSVDLLQGTLLIEAMSNNADLSKYTSQYLCCPFIPVHLHILEFCEFIKESEKHVSKVRVFRGG